LETGDLGNVRDVATVKRKNYGSWWRRWGGFFAVNDQGGGSERYNLALLQTKVGEIVKL